jgi:hypothetical protein
MAHFLLKQLNKTTPIITTGAKFLRQKTTLFAGKTCFALTIKAQ